MSAQRVTTLGEINVDTLVSILTTPVHEAMNINVVT